VPVGRSPRPKEGKTRWNPGNEREKPAVIGQERDLIRSSESAIAAFGRGRTTSHFPAGRLSLSFIGGACEGRTGVELTTARTALGRDESCEIVLDGETISRRHCEIRRLGGTYLLRDSSRNGTFVNGARIEHAQLRDGDQIRVGTNILQVHLVPGSLTNAFTGKATTSQRLGPAAAELIHLIRPQIVVKGLEEGVTQPFTEDRITMGRRLENHLILEADNVSRQHIAIERIDKQYFVRDLESANGTYLNEQRIDLAQLNDGDRVRIGNFTMLVSLVDQDCILNFRRNTK
jgi:pSer/pThr/pTyr-binding forkhead associated (FHA) protein